MFNYVGTPLELEDLESKTLNHGRFYKLDDVWVPSVTTVVVINLSKGYLTGRIESVILKRRR